MNKYADMKFKSNFYWCMFLILFGVGWTIFYPEGWFVTIPAQIFNITVGYSGFIKEKELGLND